MPARNVFHEADPFTFHGVGQQHDGRALMALRAFESFDHLLHVVPVDAAYIPTEAPVLFFQGLDFHHFLDRTINLQAIAVDDADQVVEMMVRCLHGRFPDLAFLLLAVAHDAEDLVILPVQLARQSQTDGNAQTLPQRSGRDFHARQLQPMRMTLIRRAQLPQKHNILNRAEAGKCQAQVEARRLVPGRPDDAVAVWPVGIFGIMVGHTQV